MIILRILFFFGSKNKEISLSDGYNGYLYDFTNLMSKKIIEFNGDIYHANPEIFSEDDTPNPFKRELTSRQLWERDEKKIKLAEKNGFEILTIWENEYKKNKEYVLIKCINFLKNKNN